MKLNYFLDLATYPDITEHLNIAKRILKSVKLKKSNRSERNQEKKCKKVFNGFLFLVIRLGLVIQARVQVRLLI